MHQPKSPATCQNFFRTALGTLALTGLCSHAAADDPNPYYIGFSTGVTHDSNVFRPPPPEAGFQTQPVVGDTYYSAGLLAGIDQPFGRQHFTASGNIKYNHFSKLTDLDNTSYGLNSQLDWQAMDRLSGTVSLAINQNLSSYSQTTTTFTTDRNLETDGQFSARMQYGIAALLSAEIQYTRQQVHYSADTYKLYNTSQDAVRAGIKYRPSGSLTLGAFLQTAQGRYPDAPLMDGDHQSYDRNDVVLTGTWLATGQSSFDGRVSVGHQNYSHSSNDDFSGATGQLTWNYKPTGKLSFSTTISRETGFETGFINQAIIGGNGATNDISRLTSSASISATYAATGKISLNGGLRYAHRSLTNTIASEGGSIPFGEGTDTVQSQYFGITYVPLRSLQFTCNVGHDSRSVSSGTPAYLSYPYSGTTVGCSAQLTLQ